MSKKLLTIKYVAWFAAIYHAIVGIVGIFGSEKLIQQTIELLYSAEIALSPQLIIVIKITSAYMLAFALAMAILAQNPTKYAKLVWVAIALFGVRILYKIIFYQDIKEAFGTADNISLIVITIMCGLFIWARPKN